VNAEPTPMNLIFIPFPLAPDGNAARRSPL